MDQAGAGGARAPPPLIRPGMGPRAIAMDRAAGGPAHGASQNTRVFCGLPASGALGPQAERRPTGRPPHWAPSSRTARTAPSSRDRPDARAALKPGMAAGTIPNAILAAGGTPLGSRHEAAARMARRLCLFVFICGLGPIYLEPRQGRRHELHEARSTHHHGAAAEIDLDSVAGHIVDADRHAARTQRLGAPRTSSATCSLQARATPQRPACRPLE